MRIFISFDYDDLPQVAGFRSMLTNPEVQIHHRDSSVRHDYSEFGSSEIKRQILARIVESDVTLCLVSQKTRNSGWVNWELEQSRLLRKGIVGFVLKGQPVATLSGCPDFFTRYPQYQVLTWPSTQEMNNLLAVAFQRR